MIPFRAQAHTGYVVQMDHRKHKHRHVTPNCTPYASTPRDRSYDRPQRIAHVDLPPTSTGEVYVGKGVPRLFNVDIEPRAAVAAFHVAVQRDLHTFP